MKKILGAGLAGGLVVFLWGFVSHVVLPVGEMGLRSMPVNSPLLDSMKSHLAEDGLYFFPGKEVGRKQTEAEDAVWATKYRMGPTGLLLYHPTGSEPMSPTQPRARSSRPTSRRRCSSPTCWWRSPAAPAPRCGWRSSCGSPWWPDVFAWISISVPHWNWYGFPCAFILGELIDQVVGWTLAGLAMSLLWRRAERRAILQAERHWES